MRQIPSWLRALLGIFGIFFSIGAFVGMMTAGIQMNDFGEEMSFLRSVSGDSLAEHYYRLNGEIYSCFGDAIIGASFLVLLLGLSLSVLFFCSVLHENRAEIMAKVSETQDTTQRTAQPKEIYATNANNVRVSDNLPQPVIERRRFCVQCGAEIINGTKFCAKCGNKVDTNIK